MSSPQPIQDAPTATGIRAPAVATRASRFADYVGIAGLVVVSRFVLVGVAWVAAFNAGSLPAVQEGGVLGLFSRWDSGWYLDLIANGYHTREPAAAPGATVYGFYPLYPMLARGLGALTGISPLAAGVAVSMALFIAAAILCFEYCREIGLEARTARVVVAMLCFTPHSVVFSAVYTESTFLALLLAAMLSLRREKFLAAGLFAAALSAVRSNGVLFVVFAVAWAVRRYGTSVVTRPWVHARPWMPVALAPLGLFAFWWFCYLTTGDAFAQASTAWHGWGWSAAAPWSNLPGFWGHGPNARLWVLATLGMFGASLLLLRYGLVEEFLFCLACFALYWSGTIPNSLMRYSIALFPIYIGLARWCEPSAVRLAVLMGAFGTIGGLLMVGWTLHWPLAI